MQNTNLKPQTTSLKPQKIENRNISIPTNIEKMFEAGVHYGYGKSRRHPSVSSYIYATKNSGDIMTLKNKCNVGTRNRVQKSGRSK